MDKEHKDAMDEKEKEAKKAMEDDYEKKHEATLKAVLKAKKYQLLSNLLGMLLLALR